jgi:hypothetical protein
MEFIKFNKIPRLSREVVITEKIDGTNAQIYIENDIETITSNEKSILASNGELVIYAGSRNKYLTLENDNHGFAKWVSAHAKELFELGPGRHFGEWWGNGINRGYGLKEKRFSLFNVSRWNDSNTPECCNVVPILSIAEFHTDFINDTIERLKQNGSYAAPGFMEPEGIVIYHTAGNLMFKKTILNDEKGKNG